MLHIPVHKQGQCRKSKAVTNIKEPFVPCQEQTQYHMIHTPSCPCLVLVCLLMDNVPKGFCPQHVFLVGQIVRHHRGKRIIYQNQQKGNRHQTEEKYPPVLLLPDIKTYAQIRFPILPLLRFSSHHIRVSFLYSAICFRLLTVLTFPVS